LLEDVFDFFTSTVPPLVIQGLSPAKRPDFIGFSGAK